MSILSQKVQKRFLISATESTELHHDQLEVAVTVLIVMAQQKQTVLTVQVMERSSVLHVRDETMAVQDADIQDILFVQAAEVRENFLVQSVNLQAQ